MKIYNSLTGKKEVFTPIKEGHASIYVCGLTLYDHMHVGHLKSLLTFELLRGQLEREGLTVKLVRNITDIDDKIIAKASSAGRDPMDYVNEYIGKFHATYSQMELRHPDVEPRVSEYLKEIESFTQDLINNGSAYKSTDGVYFDVQKVVSDRFELSGKKLKDLEDESRIEAFDRKYKGDFALWKKDEKYGFFSGLLEGWGRPGWHIECSVMHLHTLGEEFDIHGGGRDLVFPHHENEIIQSRARNGKNPARLWMHNAMMMHEGKKLSKSLGNSIYVKDILESVWASSLKLFLLKAHYRSAHEWSRADLLKEHVRLVEMSAALQKGAKRFGLDASAKKSMTPNLSLATEPKWAQELVAALSDDLNTPIAVSIWVRELARALKELDGLDQTAWTVRVKELLWGLVALGIAPKEAGLEYWLKNLAKEQGKLSALLQNQVLRDHLVARQAAMRQKDFAKTDQLRAKLLGLGVSIKDVNGRQQVSRKLM